MLLMSEVWFQWTFHSIICNIWRKQKKREWSYTNRVIWKACISICLAKWKVADNVTIQIVWWNWKESGKLFTKKVFLCNGLFSSTWSSQYISLLLGNIQQFVPIYFKYFSPQGIARGFQKQFSSHCYGIPV